MTGFLADVAHVAANTVFMAVGLLAAAAFYTAIRDKRLK